ncbi:hypothetical protein BDW42DRAFT_3525 [Aspergillus taichungensis]|uniref:Uncharacterized protein n=1 Tax=Aspergillus taichungensis TaxID=482145 RepID=A0A2J5HK14_9EURO|nr:hypothetical protein BDW42DRAFT_3525 [Aspergillus taichungensis]
MSNVDLTLSLFSVSLFFFFFLLILPFLGKGRGSVVAGRGLGVSWNHPRHCSSEHFNILSFTVLAIHLVIKQERA